jgi:hypothetical protein
MSQPPDPYQQQPPPPGPPPPYQPPGPPSPHQPQPGYNIMAILALVFAFVFAPVAIVLGHLAKKQIRQTGEQGEPLATVGLILGYVFTGLAVLGCCFGVLGMFGALGTSFSTL